MSLLSAVEAAGLWPMDLSIGRPASGPAGIDALGDILMTGAEPVLLRAQYSLFAPVVDPPGESLTLLLLAFIGCTPLTLGLGDRGVKAFGGAFGAGYGPVAPFPYCGGSDMEVLSRLPRCCELVRSIAKRGFTTAAVAAATLSVS